MINFSDGLCFFVIDTLEKHPKFISFMRQKRFRVSHTDSTHRQINSLESDNLIDNTRENNTKWRLFSLKDLLYLRMINECRKYGIKNSQLVMLKNHFFTDIDDSPLFKTKTPIFYGEYAIISVMFGHRTYWTLFSNGKSSFADDGGLVMINGGGKPEPRSYLTLNVNELIKEILEGTKIKDLIPEQDSLQATIRKEIEANLSNKEREILQIIRNDDYTRIEIKKKANNELLVYGGKENPKEEITIEDIAKLLKEKDYTNISISQRDGKIVNLKSDDVYKI